MDCANFFCRFLNPNIFSNLNYDCSTEKTAGKSLKSILFQKLLLPFTVGKNCSSDLKSSRPSASITERIFFQRRSKTFLTNLPSLKSFMDILLHFIEKRNKIVHCTVLCTVYLPSNNNEGHFSLCKTFVIRDKVATVSKKYIFPRLFFFQSLHQRNWPGKDSFFIERGKVGY